MYCIKYKSKLIATKDNVSSLLLVNAYPENVLSIPNKVNALCSPKFDPYQQVIMKNIIVSILAYLNVSVTVPSELSQVCNASGNKYVVTKNIGKPIIKI